MNAQIEELKLAFFRFLTAVDEARKVEALNDVMASLKGLDPETEGRPAFKAAKAMASLAQ